MGGEERGIAYIDALIGDDDNRRRVTSRFSRPSVALILAHCLAVAMVLPPEHVHEAEGNHHHHATVHRHFQLHDTQSDHDHGRAADAGEGHVVWLPGVALTQPVHQMSTPVGLAVVTPRMAVPAAAWTPGVDYRAVRSHGPPRAFHGLRAPPAFLPVSI
jgi:hypothetical protein